MKFLLFSAIACLVVAFADAQHIDHHISIKLALYTNCNIYLGNYFGNGKQLADTAWLNEKGEGVFKGKKALTCGMYFVVSPQNKILFEFMLDSAQHFSITADTAKLEEVIITGSPVNTLFRQYMQKVTPIIMQMNELDIQFKAAKNEADTALAKQKRKQWVNVLQICRDSFINKEPNSLLALMLIGGKQPELPAGTIVKTYDDTLKAGQYIKNHYWDDVAFNDDRLLYTPFFDSKLDNYFNLYVSPVADSVIKEVQYILLYARTGKEMYPYLVTKFVNQYFNPHHAGQNNVFLYLFNDFLLRGDSSFFDVRSKNLIYERAYSLMANQVGNQAPPLDMATADGKTASLYSLLSTYTLVVFWDPSCGHCQTELPRIDSIYKAKWKAEGVKLYGVNVKGNLMKDVAIFARDNNLSPDWIHVYQTNAAAKAIIESGKLNYLQTYNIIETPTLYLLDSQKRIIAKGLSIEQFDALMKVKNVSIK